MLKLLTFTIWLKVIKRLTMETANPINPRWQKWRNLLTWRNRILYYKALILQKLLKWWKVMKTDKLDDLNIWLTKHWFFKSTQNWWKTRFWTQNKQIWTQTDSWINYGKVKPWSTLKHQKYTKVTTSNLYSKAKIP